MGHKHATPHQSCARPDKHYAKPKNTPRRWSTEPKLPPKDHQHIQSTSHQHQITTHQQQTQPGSGVQRPKYIELRMHRTQDPAPRQHAPTTEPHTWTTHLPRQQWRGHIAQQPGNKHVQAEPHKERAYSQQRNAHAVAVHTQQHV